jgi:hypothetical protein
MFGRKRQIHSRSLLVSNGVLLDEWLFTVSLGQRVSFVASTLFYALGMVLMLTSRSYMPIVRLRIIVESPYSSRCYRV